MAITAPTSSTTDIEIKELPAQHYLGQRFTAEVTTIGSDVQQAFARLYTRIADAHSKPTGAPFLIASAPNQGLMEIEIGAPCTPVPEPGEGFHAGRLEAGRVAIVLYRGPYDGIGRAYEEVFAWVGTPGYSPRGDAREVYLNGPDGVKSASDYLTQVVVPIR